MALLEPKSKVLMIGALEHVGKYLTIASVMLGHFTLVLLPNIRNGDPAQNQIIEYFENIGVAFIKGDIDNHSRLVQAIRAVDVVISAAGGNRFSIEGQKTTVSTNKKLKLVGTTLHRAPSLNSNKWQSWVKLAEVYPVGVIDVDRTHVLPEAERKLEEYRQMRRLKDQSGVPYNHVVGGFFAGEILGRFNSQQSQLSLPLKIPLFGNGNSKVVFSVEMDVGRYTILGADDPRTLFKTLYIRPPENVISLNELVSLWESKINRFWERIYIPSEAFMKLYNEAQPKEKIVLALMHSAFIRGDQTNYDIDPSFGVEASQLYPHVKYTTMNEYLNRFLPE
ncbi:isoflavone reductase-like protein [Carex littledalei]|uniref:Isoflavone reductase-like protein n=1 Tax=Carex littledalei TaxID=544730 RepID=A0A833QUA6_9POAL|nr:isoflavone reductase-like protein [Carex littledalei]